MTLGKQMVIIKKLETTTLANGNLATQDFDINEIIQSTQPTLMWIFFQGKLKKSHAIPC